MTTQESEKQGGAPQVVVDANTDPDVILRALVGVVNAAKEMELSVTLHVSGIIVSGNLMSYEAYWEAFRVLVRENATGELQSFAESFVDAVTGANVDTEPDAAEGEEAGDVDASPNYIHLRDAVVWAPGAEPTLAKTLWRGRLSHVSAWSLGKYGK